MDNDTNNMMFCQFIDESNAPSKVMPIDLKNSDAQIIHQGNFDEDVHVIIDKDARNIIFCHFIDEPNVPSKIIPINSRAKCAVRNSSKQYKEKRCQHNVNYGAKTLT